MHQRNIFQNNNSFTLASNADIELEGHNIQIRRE